MDEVTPLRVYGLDESYFTGKLQAYLRYKQIPYELIERGAFREIERAGLVSQVPAVRLADGRWMTDTTPMIAWLESRFPEPEVIPSDPMQRFFSRLLEDYADEWLWRPAMHYRWYYATDAHHLSRRIVDDLRPNLPLPRLFLRLLVRRRQRHLFTRGDGVDASTRPHVEGIYLRTLEHLKQILSTRPFLLGDVPTLADYGFFGPMFRHFGLDPTASRIMRDTASEVYAWVARVWDARSDRTRGAIEPGVPLAWGPALDAIGSMYLPHLCANAQAWKARRERFDVEVEGVRYRGLRTSQYRVWCLEQLRGDFQALPDGVREQARALLEKHGCDEPLWRVREVGSELDPQGRAPFSAGASMIGL